MKGFLVNGLWGLMLALSVMFSQLVQASEQGHCNNTEYKLLEGKFLELAPIKKQHFFTLDRLCMLELGLDKDDIVERRTIFLMGSMNYEQYGDFD